MDDLIKLETNLEKLSSLFLFSVDNLQRYAPIVSEGEEPKMEDSEEHKERLKVERLENYNENKDNYKELIAKYSKDINDTFTDISQIINSLRCQEEYTIPEEELLRNIKSLKETNDDKIKDVNDKIKQTEDIINNINKENELNMHLSRYNRNILNN